MSHLIICAIRTFTTFANFFVIPKKPNLVWIREYFCNLLTPLHSHLHTKISEIGLRKRQKSLLIWFSGWQQHIPKATFARNIALSAWTKKFTFRFCSPPLSSPSPQWTLPHSWNHPTISQNYDRNFPKFPNLFSLSYPPEFLTRFHPNFVKMRAKLEL